MNPFFYLQKTDRLIFIAALVVAAIASVLMFVFDSSDEKTQIEDNDSTYTTRKYPYYKRKPQYYAYYDDGNNRPIELFPFDPNTADSTQLLRLGLRPQQVRNIYKYRAKGGVFRKATDFARIYGLTVEQYRQLEPYIRIARNDVPASDVIQPKPEKPAFRDTTNRLLKLKPNENISLNTADTALLKRVPGIGSYLARAIVNYRERLGGFYCVEQLCEITYFPQESLPYFVISNVSIRKININRLTLNELRKHPYISYYQAKTIVDHRRIHGLISDLDELSLYKDFPQEAIERLRNYVEY